jgi:hypothetical protein
VNADVFLLTDDRPALLAGDDGVGVARSEAASTGLLTDLRSDRGMEWVPDAMWLTYLQVDAPAGALRHDLAVSTHAGTLPSARLAGYTVTTDDAVPAWWYLAVIGAPVLLIGVGRAVGRRRSA